MSSLKAHFLLDPDIVFLNHGSFGACPRPVFDTYQTWQRELERQPVAFLGRQAAALMANAREKLAAYLGAAADEVVYFPNPTTAINMVARSLRLHPEDEVLTTDHEYGAMDRTWRFICQQTGARYVQQPIPLPVTNVEDFVEIFWSGVNERTKVIFISHITSPTALTFPVQAICRRARAAGLLCIVDGAHARGTSRSICRPSVQILHRCLSQVALCAKGSGLPLRPPRGATLAGAPGGQLGIPERPAQRRAIYRLSRVARHPRSGGIPDRPRSHCIPGPAPLGSGAPAVPPAGRRHPPAPQRPDRP